MCMVTVTNVDTKDHKNVMVNHKEDTNVSIGYITGKA